MSTADDLLFAPIHPEPEKAQAKPALYMVNKLLHPDTIVDVGGQHVRLGSSQGVLYFKIGDDVKIGFDRYVVVRAGDYNNAIVEKVL